MIISNAAIKHRTTVFVLMLIISLAGAYSYATLPRESAPDVQIPYIIVTTPYPGVAPSDIETSVTSEIEKKVSGISEVEEIVSQSREGLSAITIEFAPSTDITDAMQKVRDKVDEAKPEMPDDIEDPVLEEINVSEFPIMLLNIHGPSGLLKLKEIAEDLEEDIERIDGVLDAQVSGDLTREIRVEVDPYRLAAYQIPVNTLFETIMGENQNVSGGGLDLTEAKYSVRVEGEFSEPSEIFNLIISQVGGRPIYLSDVATVRDTFEDRQSISRFDGSESVTISVIKRAGKNIIRISDEVKALLDEYEPRLPTGTRIDITLDESQTIELMVSDLENNVITGLILVMGVLMVVLGFRNSALVAIAIPFSMLITFGVLQALGITLNMVVLFSLILVLGMLVDNAIVIVENIYRHMQEGKPRIQASMEATAEVAWPVITSTLTTVAAFGPLLLWPGIMGEFMTFLPKTVIIALFASLFVAMVINPTMSSILVKPKTLDSTAGPPDNWLTRGYTRMLSVALRPWIRLAIVFVGFVTLVGSAMLFNATNGKVEFFPDEDPPRAQINVDLPVGTRIEVTDAVTRRIEGMLRQYMITEDTDDPRRNIEHVTTTVGMQNAGPFSATAGGEFHKAQISIEFIDFLERRVPSRDTVEALRDELRGMPGVDVKIAVEKGGPPTGKPIEIELSGEQYPVLVELAEKTRKIVSEIDGIVDLDDDYDPGKPELRINVDRQRAAILGLSTGQVAQTLKGAINGLEVGKYREGTEDYDIVVRFPEFYRQRMEDLEAVTISTAAGDPVPLSSVADIRYTSGLASVRRSDEKRTITVSSDVAKGVNSQDVLNEAQRRLADLQANLPVGYTMSFAGENEDMNEAIDFLTKAGIAAVLIIGLILVTQFNSVLLPFIILLSFVLSWIGVFLGLSITGKPFGVIMTGVGVISLAGVVVNNSIVLIDYMEKLRQRGLDLLEAVIQAGATRLRPVLLTAITTILGLLPMVLGWNLDFRNLQFNLRSESAVWWGPMAAAVVFGLAVSTVLTLVVVPVVYVMMGRFRQWWDRKAHDPAKDAETGGRAVPVPAPAEPGRPAWPEPPDGAAGE